MAGYTRQSSSSIVNGSDITAAPLNAEFNQVLAALNNTTGHKHDGTAAEGPVIGLIGDPGVATPLNKVVVDNTNNRVGVFVDASGAGSTVEQVRIQDGAIVPVTDNDIDLGTSSVEFKDLFLDGTAHIDTLDVDADATVAGTLGVAGNSTLSGNLTVTGNTTIGNAASDTVTVTADVASPLIPSADDTYDLGASGSEWRNLYIDGTAHIDTLDVGVNGAVAGTFTVTGVTALNGGLTMDSNKFTVANTSGNVATAGTMTVTGATALDGGLTMDTDKFTVADTSGNVATAGTLAVTGTSAFTGAVTADAGVSIDNITIDGTEIDLSSGDLTLDVAGDIILNADGGDISLQDASVTFGSLTNTSGNLIIKSGTTTAATFSGANVDFAGTLDATGAATLDSTLAVAGVLSPATHVDMPDNAIIKVGTGDDLEIKHDGTNSFIANKTGILKVATETSGIAVTIGHTTSEVTIGDNLTVTGNLTVSGTQTVVDTVTMNAENAVVFEGATPDDHETTLTIIDPTADRTINLPNQSGTIPVLAAASNDQVTATPAELSILDGDTSATSTTLADADRVVVNDNGTMKQVALTDFETYMETSLDTLSNVTTVGALNAGSITSGFGAIDNGSSAITTTGTMTFGNLSDGSITATAFVDEDNMASNSATLIPTQQSVKAYVDTVASSANNVTGLNATGAEINTVADPDTSIGTTAVAGGDGIVTQDTSGNVMLQTTVDTFDTYLSQTTKTLTNKTLTSPVITGLHLNDSGFSVEGSGADGNETTVAFTNPTADRTITLPDATGTVLLADSNNVVTFDNGIIEESTTITSSSNAATLNLRDGTNFLHDLTENVTYTFSNPAASGKVSSFTLKVIQDSTARTITWPSSVDWAAATAPTITATNNGVDIFVFFTNDGGTTYYGFTAGQAMA